MPVAPGIITLTDAEGNPLQELEHEPLSDAELNLLRDYKKFLYTRGYREAVYCNRCLDREQPTGTEFRVQTSGLTIEALIKCRCRVAYGKGSGLH